MPAVRTPGIFCLEGAWATRLDDRTSVLPTLEMLERLRLATFIHRDVGTEEELYHYLGKWAQAGYRKYGVRPAGPSAAPRSSRRRCVTTSPASGRGPGCGRAGPDRDDSRRA